jgi:hypothetical protein
MASNSQLRSVAGMMKDGNALQVALNIFAWLALMTLPIRNVTPETEPSWCAVLNYAAIHHLQFGTDVIFTYGPLGFLGPHSYYSQATWFWIVLFQAISRAVYLLVLYALPLPRPGTSRTPLLLAAVILPLFTPDVFYLLFITFVGVLFCQPPRNDGLILKWGALGLVAVIALIKVTFLFSAILMLLCICLWLATNRRFSDILKVLGVWCVCLTAFWVLLARQQLANFPRWVRSSYEIAQATQLSESIQPNRNVLFYGILLWSVVIGALFWALRARPRSFPIILLLAGGIFLAWKQGFTRCDHTHFPAFFLYAGVAIVALPTLLGLDGWKWTPLVACVCLGWGSMGHSRIPVVQAFFENARFLISHDRERKTDIRNSVLYDVPNIRREIRTSSVDVVGFSQGLAIINQFNYRPAPIFQMYAATNAWLAQANADFYCSTAAPEYVIYKPRTIDERLQTMDLALVGLVLSTRYKQIMEEKGYTLLHRTSTEHALPQLELIRAGTVLAGQEIPMEGATWCKIDMQETVVEKLCRFLYQSPRIGVSLRTADGVYTRRFVPSMARTGFLVPEKVLAIAIEDSPAVHAFYQRRITFSLYRTSEVISKLPSEDLKSSTQLETDTEVGTSKRRFRSGQYSPR